MSMSDWLDIRIMCSSVATWLLVNCCFSGRVWGYQKGYQNPYIEEEQTTQWPEEKVQKDKKRSTKHTYKTKDRVTRTTLKAGGELMSSGRVSSSCSTSDTRRVNLVTNPVISHERGKDREVLTTSGTYPWSLVTQIFHNGHHICKYEIKYTYTLTTFCKYELTYLKIPYIYTYYPL
jgi:hypothetical protein